jgi:ribosomal protein L44E
MTYYTPSTRVIERSPPTRGSTLTLVCRSCGDTMQNLRSIPKLGVRRAQLVFVCPSCKAVDTKELNGAE